MSWVYLCADENPNIDKVNFININSITDDLLKTLNKIDYFKDEKNILWETSLQRIFYINALAKFLKIKSFIHYDLDVLIFKPYKELSSSLKSNVLNITPINEYFLSFSYSFIDNLSTFENICVEIINLLENPKEHENKFYLNSNKKLNEMLLLNIVYIKFPELFNMLNIIPIEQSKFVFDPADYGQYLGGLDGKPFSKKTIDIDHYVGRELIKNNLKPIMKNNTPYILFKQDEFEIVNLHIHSKKLESFVN